jgi:hypothetical protein
MKLKHALITGLVPIVLSGCNIINPCNGYCEIENLEKDNEKTKEVIDIPKPVSYKLEDLCDTAVDFKDITLNVYIEPSDVLWDYHEYREEFFGYVEEFFGKQKIDCKINFSNKPLVESLDSNSFGLEVFGSLNKITNRYYKLIGKQEGLTKKQCEKRVTRGRAVTRKGIALLNGAWEEFRLDPEITREDVEMQFKQKYKGISTKEYVLKSNAGYCVHEVLHCIGLFHPNTFSPNLVKEKDENEINNIMSLYPANFKKEPLLGYKMSNLQRELMHSFISGNNNYKSFLDSKKDLDEYILKIGIKNNLMIN